jgi:hypothetical protein
MMVIPERCVGLAVAIEDRQGSRQSTVTDASALSDAPDQTIAQHCATSVERYISSVVRIERSCEI